MRADTPKSRASQSLPLHEGSRLVRFNDPAPRDEGHSLSEPKKLTGFVTFDLLDRACSPTSRATYSVSSRAAL